MSACTLSPRMLSATVLTLLLLIVSGCMPNHERRDAALNELAERRIALDIAGLQAATRSRSQDGAYLFADAGFFADIKDADLDIALRHAAKSANFGLALMLQEVNSRTQFEATGLQESLDMSVQRGNPILTAVLLRHGARPGPQTLFRAAYADSSEQTRLLLQHSSDFSSESNSKALRMAARLGNLNTLKVFVESGKAPREQINRALLYAALTEQVAIVEYLVNRGVPVDHPDSDGCTALHYLAQDAPVEGVRFLVERGAEVNKTCRGKETPLKWAHYGDNQAVIDYLTSMGGTLL